MSSQCNAIIQSDTAGTLDRAQSALNCLRETFIFDDASVQEVVMFTGMCGSIVEVVDLLIDAMRYELKRIATKEAV